MTYTLNQVYKLLDLQDPFRFAIKQRAIREDMSIPADVKNCTEFLNRGTGKTTYLLVKAVVLSQKYKVALIGKTLEHTYNLTKRAKEMCEKLGLSPYNILTQRSKWPDNILGRHADDTIELYDY
jgi:hypothetical protein